MPKLTNAAKEEREAALIMTLSADARKELARIAMPPLDFLKSVYMDNDTPLDIAVNAARAAAPYEHGKLPADLNINDNRNTPLFDMNMLKKLSSDELQIFIQMSEKLGIDFGGHGGNKKGGDIVDVTPELEVLHPVTAKLTAKISKDLQKRAAPAKKKVKA